MNLAAIGIVVSGVPLQSAAQTPPASSVDNTEDIVVVAQRSGIPVWRVVGPRTTVVLVGSIGSVAPGTKWDAGSLDAALEKADRIMFPERLDVSFGLFSLIGLIGKWRKQASLPKGQTLQSMTTPTEWARLAALRDQGILKAGFERKHPYHLAVALHGRIRDKRKNAPGADDHVRRAVRRNKSKQVPLTQVSLKEITNEFFSSAPQVHVACLMDTVAMVEAGTAGIQARAAALQARSQAWAERRVPEALSARAEFIPASCWPRGSRVEQQRDAALSPTVRGLLNQPQVTLAVLSLDTLAEPGGVLDDIVAAGFDVRGPAWQR